jgi:hypothetical protein
MHVAPMAIWTPETIDSLDRIATFCRELMGMTEQSGSGENNRASAAQRPDLKQRSRPRK